jgi:4-hydroxy 2-oxovalerate aldolase
MYVLYNNFKMKSNFANFKNIKILDCTLRDGGSINNWNFGSDNISKILQNLNDAGIDIIECGFLDDKYSYNEDCSISCSITAFDEKISKVSNRHFKSVAMINIGKFNVDNLPDKTNSLIDGIRLMFKKEEIENAVRVSEAITQKGYSLSLNPVSITTYSENDVKNLCETANKLNPSIVYIIDTYGLLDKNETLRYYNLFDSSLNEGIEIGYHAHNNLQLAFSNSTEIVNASNGRTVVVDGSLYGMGKRAGNMPTELIADYLNKNYSKEYDINKINVLIETIIMPLHNDFEWGYSLIHYIAAVNKCHSDYVSYLYNEKHLNFNVINSVIKNIAENHKLTFNKEYIDELYNSTITLV